MKRRMMIGFVMILIALLLAALMVIKVPTVLTQNFPVDNPVELPPNSTINFYNVTWQPGDKQNYHIEIVISPYYGPPLYGMFQIDFWVVNETGLGMLVNFLEWEQMKKEYPDGKGFIHIVNYARGINVTRETRFALRNLKSNYAYCLTLINFFENSQNVSVSIKEIYEELPHPILESNIANIVITFIVFTIGLYMAVTSRQHRVRRAKIVASSNKTTLCTRRTCQLLTALENCSITLKKLSTHFLF